MKKKARNAYLLYIGTTKIVFLRADVSGPVPEVVAYCTRLGHGFERGLVKDLPEASETLRQAVRSIVSAQEDTIVPCRVVVSNAYIKNYTFQSSVYFQTNPHALALRDIRLAIAQTRSVATIPLGEIIIQAVPQEFLVNDLPGIRNPIGLEASRLGVTLRLLTMDYLGYSNLRKALERSELEVIDFVPSILASADAVLEDSEKQEGVMLVAIGGEATHFACYKGSVLIAVHSIPFGADHITQVIEQKLNINHLDAQRIKEAFGSAGRKNEFRDELIPVPASNRHQKYHVSRAQFETHMSSGLELFLEKIGSEIKLLQHRFAPLDQIVVTGGGAELEGLVEVMKEEISPSVRIGRAEAFLGPDGFVKKPAFSAALGGIRFSHKISEPAPVLSSPQNWISRATRSAREWIFENF